MNMDNRNQPPPPYSADYPPPAYPTPDPIVASPANAAPPPHEENGIIYLPPDQKCNVPTVPVRSYDVIVSWWSQTLNKDQRIAMLNRIRDNHTILKDLRRQYKDIYPYFLKQNLPNDPTT